MSASQSASRQASEKRYGSRFRARCRAVDFLYEAESRDYDPVQLVEERVPMGRRENSGVRPVAAYTQRIVEGVAVELNTLDDAIDAHLQDGWAIDRLPAVERAILRVAAWELMFNDEVPPRVTFTEGAELARYYSNESASKYVHAVLDAIHQARSTADEAPAANESAMPVEPLADPDVPAQAAADPDAQADAHEEAAEPTNEPAAVEDASTTESAPYPQTH